MIIPQLLKSKTETEFNVKINIRNTNMRRQLIFLSLVDLLGFM